MASIHKRGGVWYIYYRVDGHKVRRRVSRSKKIAQLALSDVIVKLEKKQLGFAPPPKKHTKPLDEFLEEYRKYSETNHRDATVVRYGAIIDNFTEFLKERPEGDRDVAPALGERPHLPLGHRAAADHHDLLALQVQQKREVAHSIPHVALDPDCTRNSRTRPGNGAVWRSGGNRRRCCTGSVAVCDTVLGTSKIRVDAARRPPCPAAASQPQSRA